MQVKIEKLNIILLKTKVYDKEVVNTNKLTKNKYKSKNDKNVIKQTKKIFNQTYYEKIKPKYIRKGKMSV